MRLELVGLDGATVYLPSEQIGATVGALLGLGVGKGVGGEYGLEGGGGRGGKQKSPLASQAEQHLS